MADELTKIDLGGAAQELRDKIRSAFVDMIPPEQWAAMIQAELQASRSLSTTPTGKPDRARCRP